MLQKNNTDAYTPTEDYHPATKKYVDDNSGGGSTVFIKEGGGVPTVNDDKYTGGNNGFGGQETPEHPIDVDGVLRKRGKGQSKGIQFDTQTLHSLGINDLSHLTVQEVNDGGTRFYLIPKGNTTTADQLASGIKMFSTDYEADGTNYHDWGQWVTQNELISNSKRNGSFPKNLPFVWKYQDSNRIMKLQAKANASLMLGVSSSEEKEWTLFNPIHLGSTTCLLGREGVSASEWINNAYYDGSWKRILTGFAQRFSLDTFGQIIFWTAVSGAADSVVSWVKRYTIKNDGNIIMHSIPTFADNTAAASLDVGSIYKTATGELRIKI